MDTPALRKVLAALDDRLAKQTSDRLAAYCVPGLWVDPFGAEEERLVTPETFFVESIVRILARPAQARVRSEGGPGDWSHAAIAYNLFVRAGAAWDHNRDGKIAVEPNAAGWRETGTFLKAITLLPFIRSLGCNTVHLLPITAIGRDGNKGSLGSPFAIRDPYILDERLVEPALSLGPDVEFAAFVEAAHHLGIRVVVEFVFRTAAKDAAWAAEHPEWFYWIRADVPDRTPGDRSENSYGAPLWTPGELEQVYAQVGTRRYADLPVPHAVYRQMFLPPPRPADVLLVNGQWRARVQDPLTGGLVEARIPGAFADWTPDSDQPPWSDVTYLRLYNHPDFNYIAYNTVRFYEQRLALPENAVLPLWDRIVEIIPHYQQAYGVDGVMIDMGHALPRGLKQRIVDRARQVDPDFALWAEDFDLRQQSRAEGYNLCVGPFMQTVRSRENLLRWLETLSRAGVPVPFMATSENHNVPRAVTWPGGLAYAAYAQVLGSFLPGIPYIHGGLEVAETRPVNTGFDFAPEEVSELPASRLYLFSEGNYSWTQCPNLVARLRRVHAVRERYSDLLSDSRPESLQLIAARNSAVVAFRRGLATGLQIIVAANSDMFSGQDANLQVPAGTREAVDLLDGEVYRAGPGSKLELSLEPGQVVAFLFENSRGLARS